MKINNNKIIIILFIYNICFCLFDELLLLFSILIIGISVDIYEFEFFLNYIPFTLT